MLKQKEGTKIIFKTILHMLIFNIISFIIFYLSYLDATELETTSNTGLGLSVPNYKINQYIFSSCLIFYILLYMFIWKKILKKDLISCKKIHQGYIVAFIFLFCIFIFNEFILFAFTDFMSMGLSHMVNFSYNLIIMGYIIWPVLYSILDIVYDIIKKKSSKIYEKNSHSNSSK